MAMAIRDAVGRRLFHWRKASGLSQTACAERVGVQQGTWSEWEGGTRRPGPDKQAALELLTGGTIPASDWAEQAAGAA